MLPANIRMVKVKTFKNETEEALAYGDVIYFQGRGCVTDIKGSDNQDGTQNLTYEVKAELVDIRKAKDQVTEPVSIVTDKKLRGKSESQALRQFAYRVGQETDESEEGLYKLAIQEGRDFLQNKLDNN